MIDRLKVGTRKSALALAQASIVERMLKEKYPGLAVEIVKITTSGDKARGNLRNIGGKGLFTREIEAALLDGRIDAAVHSLKDLPVDLPAGLILAAVPPRDDPRDALITVKDCGGIEGLKKGARVGTGSERRAAQLRICRSDVKPVDARGNVDTRVAKLLAGEFDALILAAAGLSRLGEKRAVCSPIPPSMMLGAPGQGALAVEAAENNEEALALLSCLNDDASARAVGVERGLLKRLGGGCRTPFAALCTREGELCRLEAFVGRSDGSKFARISLVGKLGGENELIEDAFEKLKLAGLDEIMESCV